MHWIVGRVYVAICTRWIIAKARFETGGAVGAAWKLKAF
jgi:hypothetical protein